MRQVATVQQLAQRRYASRTWSLALRRLPCRYIRRSLAAAAIRHLPYAAIYDDVDCRYCRYAILSLMLTMRFAAAFTPPPCCCHAACRLICAKMLLPSGFDAAITPRLLATLAIDADFFRHYAFLHLRHDRRLRRH